MLGLRRLALAFALHCVDACDKGITSTPPAASALPTTGRMTPAPEEPWLVVRAGHLVDPETGRVSENQDVLIRGGRIERVGADVAVPAGAREIDLGDAYVLPGLFDVHTHLCSDFSPRWHAEDLLVHSLAQRTGLRALIGSANARQMLEAGFTTVRDLGNAGDYADVDLVTAIEQGFVVGPTIVPAGRIIAPFGGQFSWRVRPEVLDDPEYLFADTSDELRKAVRANAYYGAKIIKIVVDGQAWKYSTSDIETIVAEAREAGLQVAAHCQTSEGARRAAQARVASIEHGWDLGEADLALIHDNGVVLVTTDFTVEVLETFGWSQAEAKAIHGMRVDRLRRAYRAGVTIAFGTDVMTASPDRTRGELAMGYVRSFVEAGVPAAEILKSMTVHSARLLRMGDVRGALRVGFAADLVATRDNPLLDPTALERIHFVMKSGKAVTIPSTP